ncbi:ABC transporter permease [Hazenella coriacea]|uniref:ABC-2 type transport system permease protein n=1 Tax=Hazenella coriacea TaxID=1179467 RepID=A0A4V2UVM4_9BACL|nr:ABC transporter permease [Hazenella coriacea]TCS95837.1 hypothetical protein EDD58_102419 [Hazenella coriacea]
MIFRILSADWIKMKRTWLVWLTLLGPVFMLFAQSVNYGVRADYLLKFGWEGKNSLFFWIFALLGLTLMLGSCILAAMMAGHEHDANAWKQIFALPVSRWQLFISKAIWLCIFIGISALLTVVSMGIFGVVVGLPQPIPWVNLTKLIMYPYLATIPILAIQLALSLNMKNQAIPITVGVIGSILGPIFAMDSNPYLHWVPLAYPSLADIGQNPEAGMMALYGGLVGVALILIGAIQFSRKEVR